MRWNPSMLCQISLLGITKSMSQRTLTSLSRLCLSLYFMSAKYKSRFCSSIFSIRVASWACSNLRLLAVVIQAWWSGFGKKRVGGCYFTSHEKLNLTSLNMLTTSSTFLLTREILFKTCCFSSSIPWISFLISDVVLPRSESESMRISSSIEFNFEGSGKSPFLP